LAGVENRSMTCEHLVDDTEVDEGVLIHSAVQPCADTDDDRGNEDRHDGEPRGLGDTAGDRAVRSRCVTAAMLLSIAISPGGYGLATSLPPSVNDARCSRVAAPAIARPTRP
jgi:hypothetical protein